MCGIVGYVGKEQRCVEVLMEGLRNLEYRGYDSAGLALALPDAGGIGTAREVGPLDNLVGSIGGRNGDFFKVRAGVGHTRWATHGRPSEANAHPHTGGGSSGPEVAVVHTGIIENHAQLRDDLKGRGCEFRSETDTEVIAHLLAERVATGESLREALVGTLEHLEGSFAVAVMSADEPETIVAARHQSPLVVGLGEGERAMLRYFSSNCAALPRERLSTRLPESPLPRLPPPVWRFGRDGVRLRLLTAVGVTAALSVGAPTIR